MWDYEEAELERQEPLDDEDELRREGIAWSVNEELAVRLIEASSAVLGNL